jgi:LAO/AO transport system kinase
LIMNNVCQGLVSEMLSGSIVALSRLMSMVEKEDQSVPEIMDLIRPHLKKAYCIGITGFSGVGKSTLINALTALIRKKGLSVGILAVDPSSIKTGGAILGDRIRMQQHASDNEVFIRSMATRGSYGGLSRATSSMVKLLDAFGKDIIIVETIGVSQIDVEIRRIADTVVLVMVPQTGDSIQFIKSGVMEIADIIVVNKAENDEKMIHDLRETLSLFMSDDNWEVPIVATKALENQGIEELYEQIEKHRSRKI